MSNPIQILTKEQQRIHDDPPAFNAEQRKAKFYFSVELQSLLSNVRGAKNKVFFVVSFIYFRETAQFFESAEPKDLMAACKRLGVERAPEWAEYNRTARKTHRETISAFFGFKPFTDDAKEIVKGETIKSLRSKRSPARCFRLVMESLKDNRIEIPLYGELAKIISYEYNQHHSDLVDIVKKHLAEDVRKKLDGLTEKPNTPDGSISSSYALTLTKRYSHSTRESKIRKNVGIHATLLESFELVKPVLDKLNLNNEGVKAFATMVEYDQVFQIKRKKDDDRYLHLVVFIANQFYRLQDVLAKILITLMTQTFNSAERDAKNELYKNRSKFKDNTHQVFDDAEDVVGQLNQIKNILQDAALNSEDKVALALKVIIGNQKKVEDTQVLLSEIKEQVNQLGGDDIFIRILKSKANSLQRSCKGILMGLTFDFESSNKDLVMAIKMYRECEGKVDANFPLGVIDKKYRGYINKDSEFDIDLYKVLLFHAVAKAIKSEALNLHHSHLYTSLEHDLISRERFKQDRDKLLSLAGMQEFSSYKKVMNELSLELDRQFHETNRRIIGNENSFIVSNGEEGFRVVSQRNTRLQDTDLVKQDKLALYPSENQISLVEALYSVNKATSFLEQFIHRKHKNIKDRPEDKTFFAGIMGLGNHLGAPKIAKLSQNTINESTLASAVSAYFSVENVRSAIDVLVHKTSQLPVANIFQANEEILTSSDGSKYIVLGESLNANYSFKYGGRDQVISAYTFIDSRNLFFYSTVISGAEYEAHYMLDGVLYNQVIKSTMHTTDTHGYSEAVSGLAHLLKVSFAPRIRDFQSKYLYSFKPRQHYKKLDYPVLPVEPIDKKLIEGNYEDILRLVVSIKLGETTASRVFRRMNSKSKHNPLYDAVKEFGRIPKTLHLLRYMDDEEYRSAIQRQLNKGESGNKLDRALAVGSPFFDQVEKEDQELVDSCKRLLKNVIVCWNYMHLSKLLKEASSNKEKQRIIDKICETSTVTYKHFQFQGEFPFSANRLVDSMNFNFADFLNPNIVVVMKDD